MCRFLQVCKFLLTKPRNREIEWRESKLSNLTIGLHRDMWTNLRMNGIKNLTSLKSFPNTPSVSLTTQRFSTPRDTGMKYGQRLYGYFVPPETGNYIFAVSCTNECDLMMSKSDLAEKKEVILTREKSG